MDHVRVTHTHTHTHTHTQTHTRSHYQHAHVGTVTHAHRVGRGVCVDVCRNAVGGACCLTSVGRTVVLMDLSSPMSFSSITWCHSRTTHTRQCTHRMWNGVSLGGRLEGGWRVGRVCRGSPGDQPYPQSPVCCFVERMGKRRHVRIIAKGYASRRHRFQTHTVHKHTQ
jgi:hypothetical protein